MEYYLRREASDDIYPLNNVKDKFVLGRSPHCDIHFKSPHISRQHCEITRLRPHGTLIIRNLKDTNVTYVEDDELRRPTDAIELRNGTVIGLGVPLRESRTNANFVFLRVCQNQVVASSTVTVGQDNVITGTAPQSSSALPIENEGKGIQESNISSSSNISQQWSSVSYQHRKERRRSCQKEISTHLVCDQETNNNGGDDDDDDIIVLDSPVPNALQRQNAIDSRFHESHGPSDIVTPDKTHSFRCNQNESIKSTVNNSLELKERRLSADCSQATSSISKPGNLQVAVEKHITNRSQSETSDQVEVISSKVKHLDYQKKSESMTSSPSCSKLLNEDVSSAFISSHLRLPSDTSSSDLQSNIKKISRGSLGFMPSFGLDKVLSPEKSHEKSETSKPSLNQCKDIHSSIDNIREENSCKIEQSALQPAFGNPLKVVKNELPEFALGMGKGGKIPDNDMTDMPDPDESVSSSVKESPLDVNELNKGTSDILVSGEKHKEPMKRKRISQDSDKDEEKENGKRIRSDVNSSKKEDEQIHVPELIATAAVTNKQMKEKLIEEKQLADQLRGRESPLDDSDVDQNRLKSVEGLGEKGKVNSSVKEKTVTMKSKSNREFNVMESPSPESSDSDEPLSRLSVTKRKRKHQRIYSSGSESESDSRVAHRTGLKGIEENLVGKKCVIPLSRVSPDILAGVEKGKSLIMDDNEELKLVSPSIETESNFKSDDDDLFSFDFDDELPDLLLPITSKIPSSSTPKFCEKEKTKQIFPPDIKDLSVKKASVNKEKDKPLGQNSNVLKTSKIDSSKHKEKSKEKFLEKNTHDNIPNKKEKDLTSKCASSVSATEKSVKAKGQSEGKSAGVTLDCRAKNEEACPQNSVNKNKKEHKDHKNKGAFSVIATENGSNAESSSVEVKSKAMALDRSTKNKDTHQQNLINKIKKEKDDISKCSASVGATEKSVKSGEGKSATVKPGCSTNNQEANQQNLVNKKCDDDFVVKIKKEKIEGEMEAKVPHPITPVVIKKEPHDTVSEDKMMVDDDDDGDDVLFMYSQINETIWVSSDEEETPSPEKASYGPLPTSPDLGLASLFEEKSFDSASEVIQKAGANSPSSVSEEDDDQWFPVLSQSFWDDDDNMMESVTSSEKEIAGKSKPKEASPTPGPSGLNVSPSSDTSVSSWWPELSQGFFDDDDEDDVDNLVTSAPHEELKAKVLEKDLESVIEKCKNRSTRKAQLIEPKAPLPRTSNDSLRKRSRSSSSSDVNTDKGNCAHSSSKRKDSSSGSHSSKERRDSSDSRPSKERRDSSDARSSKERKDISQAHSSKERKDSSETIAKPKPSPASKKRKKGPSLRDNLSHKFNLASYKALAKQQSKGKQPTHKKAQSVDTKVPEQLRKSHLISDEPRSGENISVLKKKTHQENKEHLRPSVAAKITRKTRGEKLTEINLFPSPQLSSTRSKKSTFTIPKKKVDSASDTGKSGKSVTKPCSTVENDKASSESLKDKYVSQSPVCLPLANVPSSSSYNQNNDQPQNNKPEVNVPPDQHNDNDHGTSTVQPQESEKRDDEDKEKEIDTRKLKGILKIVCSGNNSKKKSVHFPKSNEELNKVKFISPRKNSEKLGQLAPRMREVLPKELIFEKHNIPLNFPDHFIAHVCMWNYDWLDTYRKVKEKMETTGKTSGVKPPPVVKSINYPTLILYESFHDYKDIFSDLLYLEVWENIYRDWLHHRNSSISMPAYIDKVEEVCIGRRREASSKSWRVILISLLSQDDSNKSRHPQVGCLINLKVTRESEKKKIQNLFGYVQDLRKQKKRMMPKEIEAAYPYADVALILEVRIAKDPGPEIRSGNLLNICNLSYIRPFTRTWEGLCKLPLSPLCNDILRPKQESFMHNHSGKYLVQEMPLNESQTQAVIQVSGKCIFDPLLPKLSLIHGPPGTGKTRTIVSLVAQIVRLSEQENMSNCRILLCAPSNAVADELTLRLVKLKEIAIRLRVVRVGISDNMIPEVRSYSLDSFTSKHIRNILRTPRNQSAKKEWERKNKLLKIAEVDLMEARKENKGKEELKKLERRRDELARSLSETEKRFAVSLTPAEQHQLHKQCQRDYLIGAQVITTTLGGCFSGPMAEVFTEEDHPFTCCIVDEAGQCKETEMWLPLLYSMRKLVLVGDHQQLPATVLSQLAQDKNMKQSLFERLYHRFVIELQKDDLVHTLDTQYRMHPEIARWPSTHFYFSKVKTSPDIIQERSYNCLPYAVFDVKDSLEQRGPRNELSNPTECRVVHLILESLEPCISKLKIGIITPYQCQKCLLEKELAGFCKRLNININTIDGFQGQEKDVIILSFVRANASAQIGFLSEWQRLNVALTRARRSCFIVANLASLGRNKDWQSLIADAKARKLVNEVHGTQMNKAYFTSVLMKQNPDIG